MNGEATVVETGEGAVLSGAAVSDMEAPATQDDDGEMKLTIRKLELPVRPRGVLAE